MAAQTGSFKSASGDSQTAPIGASPMGGWIKRTFDICLAVVALIAVFPLLLVIVAAIKLQDGGPALFRQRRIGVGGHYFECLKFRSMVLNAEDVLQTCLAANPKLKHEWETTRKLRNDPRITPLGRFLRRSSLDELPQLINVLMGDMSFVGPRPIVADEIKMYDDNIEFYYKTRPGITGLWQISGRNDVDYTLRVAFDVQYTTNWSLLTDVYIIIRTIPAVIKARGSY